MITVRRDTFLSLTIDVPMRGPVHVASVPAALGLSVLEVFTGRPGTAATVTVAATNTIAPDQPASVTNIGTETAVELVFDIPRAPETMLWASTNW